MQNFPVSIFPFGDSLDAPKPVAPIEPESREIDTLVAELRQCWRLGDFLIRHFFDIKYLATRWHDHIEPMFLG